MELKQRKLLNTNKFLIRDNGIEWTLREKFSQQSTFFEFDELNFKKATKYKKYNLAFMILSVLSIVALILSLFPTGENSAFGQPAIPIFLIMSIVFSLLTYFFRIDNIYIPTERGIHITMYNGLPNKKAFSAFLKNLKSEAKQSLMDKYFNNDNVDQKQLYLFLEERGLLDQVEKQKIEESFKTAERTVIKGFGKD
ncbi:hypothetical protein [Aquimarina aquimarini]|uniref:hypothetical protein n=1 Tax=Aquimarina aquimarini TaxID=1191734 RepID=UPI000D5564AA|nr:hypothetical protein [Aquimarina aquimarini]